MAELPFKINNDLADDWVPLSRALYRPNTVAEKFRVNFMFYRGGIGDYVCWMSAVMYVLENHKHVQIDFWVQSHFLPIAKKLIEPKYKDRVVFKDVAEIDSAPREQLNPAWFPLDTPNGVGMHLIDLGFVYYAGVSPYGKYKEHVRLDVTDIDFKSEWGLDGKDYVVVTTGFTSPTRQWKARGVNGVVDYLNSVGVTPVFLGKASVYVGMEKEYKAQWSDETDYSKGIDLREKTTILEATAIMSKAKAVVGLDNGLLHLAGTQDVPIVMGMSTVLPADRQIRRPMVPKEQWPKNETTFITPDPRKLPCVGCQSKMRFHAGQDFSFCYYKDMECLNILSDPEPWINALKRYLGK